MRGRRGFWPLLLLCVFAGSRWLLDEAVPLARSTTVSAAAGCGLAAVGLFGWSLWRPRVEEAPAADYRIALWKPSLLAAALLVGPALCGAFSDRHINANAATLSLALTPVVVAVASAASSLQDELAGQLWPGLAGLAGLLLLLPIPNFASWRASAALAALPLVSGVAATLLNSQSPDLTSQRASLDRAGLAWMSIGLLIAAFIFALLFLPELRNGQGTTFSWIACGTDGLMFTLGLFALRQAGSRRWSAQFLLIPFVTILEGVVLLRPTLTSRSWIGMLLIVVGGLYLLLPSSSEV